LFNLGAYELKVEKPGFETYVRSGVMFKPERHAVNMTLNIGAVSQSVNVDADAPLLRSENAAVAHIVDGKTITGMPLLDRRSSQFQRLKGFVVANGTGGNATFAIAGGSGNNANYLIDGGTP